MGNTITVSVNGQQVTGSPFPVSVSNSPILLGQPVKVVTGLQLPTSVAIISEGDLACLCDTRLVKFDKEGKEHTLVNFSNNNLFPGAYAIATDDEDKVYCASVLSNRILCCDENGGNIQVHKVQQVNGPGHDGVAVVGDEVMVTERNNASHIMIYAKQLKYVRYVQQAGDRKYHRLSVNTRGNTLYVTASDNFIHVLSKDGNLLGIHGVNRLNCPSTTCASGEYVIMMVTTCRCTLLQEITSLHLVSKEIKKENL